MSCNGCRVLRKGCNENCILRQSLQGIETPQAQGHATVFVAKFFGRAGLISFLSAVPESQRPALFQSLLFEACGRTVNPVTGAVGLLSTGKWLVCQSAVEKVLRGGVLRPIEDFSAQSPTDEYDEASRTNKTSIDFFSSRDLQLSRPQQPDAGLDLCKARMSAKRRASPPSLYSDESETTTMESGSAYRQIVPSQRDPKLLRLFF